MGKLRWEGNNLMTYFWLSYFVKYNAHTSIAHTWISQRFLAKKLFLFFKNNFTRINHCKFIHHNRHLKPFLSYLPCIVCKEYFSIIFNVKKCTLYFIKYSNYKISLSARPLQSNKIKYLQLQNGTTYRRE